jgi:hypothetical protein
MNKQLNECRLLCDGFYINVLIDGMNKQMKWIEEDNEVEEGGTATDYNRGFTWEYSYMDNYHRQR